MSGPFGLGRKLAGSDSVSTRARGLLRGSHLDVLPARRGNEMWSRVRRIHIPAWGVLRPSLTMLGVSRVFGTLRPALLGVRHFALMENPPSSTQARV